MRFLTLTIAGALALLSAGALSVAAEGDLPGASDVLFNLPHFSTVKAGKDLTYQLEQKFSDEKLLGKPLKDTITVSVKKVADDGKRDLDVAVFTGDYARPLQSVPGLTGNPLLVIFLDRAVKNYAMLAGGKTSYLKNRLKVELAKHSKVERTKVSYNGKEVDGYRVSVVPFELDPNRHKMRGYHGSSYSFVVSDAVPGYFAEMTSVLESPKEHAPRLEEWVRFVGIGDTK